MDWKILTRPARRILLVDAAIRSYKRSVTKFKKEKRFLSAQRLEHKSAHTEPQYNSAVHTIMHKIAQVYITLALQQKPDIYMGAVCENSENKIKLTAIRAEVTQVWCTQALRTTTLFFQLK
jgi:hypothetical protein